MPAVAKWSFSSVVVKPEKLISDPPAKNSQDVVVEKQNHERKGWALGKWGPSNNAYWTEGEKEEFKWLLTIHGKKWDIIAKKLNNKTEK